MSHLTHSIESGIATIILDRSPQNRIDDQMVSELATAIEDIERSDARVVLLRAKGDNFSFGGDILPWPDATSRQLRARFEGYMDVFNRFERLPLPVIAVVHGLCAGGGFELALRSDVIFASEAATFCMPEQSLALVTLLGGIYRVAERAGRARAMEWALTSERVPAATMEHFGVINRVVADVDLLSEAHAFAEKLVHSPTRAHAAHKALLRAWSNGGHKAADDLMFNIAMPLFETEDAKAGLASAIEALKAGAPRPVLKFMGR